MTTTSNNTTTIDALTPRQEQVIQLIAAGRTNPQIATELDISIDGVKWHVRELMSKLAADSRDEAVATWQSQRSVARRRKIGRFAAVAVGLAAAAVAAGVVLVAVAGQNTPEDEPVHASSVETPTATAEPTTAAQTVALTPGELLEQMEQAIIAGGEIFHVTSSTDVDDLEAWFDFAEDRSRVERRDSGRISDDGFTFGLRWRTLVINGAIASSENAQQIDSSDPINHTGLGEASSWSMAILSCGLGGSFFIAFDTMAVQNEDATFDGVPAFVLRTESIPDDLLGHPWLKLYIDKSTMLPIGYESGWDVPEADTRRFPSPVPPPYSSAYTWEFIAAADLPTDHFLPSSLGYSEGPGHAAELLAALALVRPIYWFGDPLDLGESLPSVPFSQVIERTAPQHSEIALLTYERPGGVGTNIEVWNVEDWNQDQYSALELFLNYRGCVDEETVELGDRSVRLLKAESAPPPSDGFGAPQGRPSCGTGECATPEPGLNGLGSCASQTGQTGSWLSSPSRTPWSP